MKVRCLFRIKQNESIFRYEFIVRYVILCVAKLKQWEALTINEYNGGE